MFKGLTPDGKSIYLQSIGNGFFNVIVNSPFNQSQTFSGLNLIQANDLIQKLLSGK